jgi:hypothetical protein
LVGVEMVEEELEDVLGVLWSHSFELVPTSLRELGVGDTTVGFARA